MSEFPITPGQWGSGEKAQEFTDRAAKMRDGTEPPSFDRFVEKKEKFNQLDPQKKAEAKGKWDSLSSEDKAQVKASVKESAIEKGKRELAKVASEKSPEKYRDFAEQKVQNDIKAHLKSKKEAFDKLSSEDQAKVEAKLMAKKEAFDKMPPADQAKYIADLNEKYEHEIGEKEAHLKGEVTQDDVIDAMVQVMMQNMISAQNQALQDRKKEQKEIEKMYGLNE